MYCPGCASELAVRAAACGRCGRGFPPDVWEALLQRPVTVPAVAAGETWVGALLEGRYRIEERVAAGGMGEVFRGTDARLGRRVAVKFLAKRHVGDEALVARFLREGRAAAQLDHPNVVTVLSAGEEHERPYVVMRFVEGRTLAALRGEAGRLSPSRAIALVAQLCDALAHLHERGLVHRDVKPQNVIVEPSGRAVLLDFGILRNLDQETQHALVAGTPEYMAPEQAAAPERVDGRADLYSLGVTLFELVTGRLPFEAGSPFELLLRHREAPIPSASAYGAPAALDAVLARALAKEPAARFESAGALREALLSLVEPAELDPRAWPLAVARGEGAPSPRPRRPTDGGGKTGSRWLQVAGASAAVVLGGSCALWWLAGDAPRDGGHGEVAHAAPTPVEIRATAEPATAPRARVMPLPEAGPPSDLAGAGRRPAAPPDVSAGRLASSPSAPRSEVRPRRPRRASAASEAGSAPSATEPAPRAATPAAPSAPRVPPTTSAAAPPHAPTATSPAHGASSAGERGPGAAGQSAILQLVVRDGARASWAALSIDGQPLGERAAARREVSPGEHVVSAARPGFRGVETRVRLLAGETRKVLLRLQPAP